MSIPKYIVNFDELAQLLGNGINLSGTANTDELNKLVEDYFEKLLELLKKFLGLNLVQQSTGIQMYIPALQFDYQMTYSFDDNAIITGITYSQTGWKVYDCWSLYIGNTLIFDRIYTKELGEHKVFNAFYHVKAGEIIKFIHHNSSGNSKQVWFDIDYLKEKPECIIHEYDFKIIMRWESNSYSDVDLFLELDTGQIINWQTGSFILDKNKNNTVYFHEDHTKHNDKYDRKYKPEFITILGKPADTAKVYIQNFNSEVITENITIDIYKKDIIGNDILISDFSIKPEQVSENEDLIYICSINLINQEIYEEE